MIIYNYSLQPFSNLTRSINRKAFQEIGEFPPTVYIETDSKIPEGMKVVQEDGKVYVKDNDIMIDITEDLADGQADVCYEKDGKTYRYVIEESPSVPGAYDYYLVEE